MSAIFDWLADDGFYEFFTQMRSAVGQGPPEYHSAQEFRQRHLVAGITAALGDLLKAQRF